MKQVALKNWIGRILVIPLLAVPFIGCSSDSSSAKGRAVMSMTGTDEPAVGVPIVAVTRTDIVEEKSRAVIATETNEEGGFELRGLLPNRQYVLKVDESSGFASNEVTFTTPQKGQTKEIGQLLGVIPMPPEGVSVYKDGKFIPFEGKKCEILSKRGIIHSAFHGSSPHLTYVTHDELKDVPEYNTGFYLAIRGAKNPLLTDMTYYRSHSVTNRNFLYRDGSGPKFQKIDLPGGWYVGYGELEAVQRSGRILVNGNTSFVPGSTRSYEPSVVIREHRLPPGYYCLVMDFDRRKWREAPPEEGFVFRVGPVMDKPEGIVLPEPTR